MADPILIAKGDVETLLHPRMANRHGLVAGATGTGKTVTLQVLAERFSQIGVPVFAADIKGDLSGISQPGAPKPKILERIVKLGLPEYQWAGSPVVFWDVFGEQGHPMRTTVSEMGPLLLARLLNLNETQSGVLTIIFKIADDQGLLLLDLKDLRAMAQHVGENARQYTTQYGNVSAASVGAIQRALLALEGQGGEAFFGEPSFDLGDLLQTDAQGRGVVNILAADKLMQSPKLYATFLLWLLAELFEQLPEVGDLDRPKLVFFFDEAHLLFSDAPSALQEKVEQVVRLVRSKGVGVYFVTQSPGDIPDAVLGQLGNRVQHALRAFTPKDQKVIRATAENFRANPNLDTVAALTELGVGEALVSFLNEKGQPEVVQRALVVPPASQIGAATAEQRDTVVKGSLIYGHYEALVDRESAYELLRARADESAVAERAEQERIEAERAAAAAEKARAAEEKARAAAERAAEKERAAAERERAAAERERLAAERAAEKARAAAEREEARRRAAQPDVGQQAMKFLTSRTGQTIVRGLFGSLLGKKR